MLSELAPPPGAALPVADFAAHLRLPEGFADGEEAGLELYLRAACAAVEGMTGKALLARRFLWKVTRWRDSCRAVIPVAPVSHVASLTLIRPGGGWEAVDPSRYALVPDGFAPALAGPRGGRLPDVPADGVAEVELDAGYGEAWTDVPADLRQAVLLLAAEFHEQRHISMERAGTAPVGVRALVARYREARL